MSEAMLKLHDNDPKTADEGAEWFAIAPDNKAIIPMRPTANATPA